MESGVHERETYSAHYVLVACEMGFAVLAAEDAVGIQVDVVG